MSFGWYQWVRDEQRLQTAARPSEVPVA